MFWSNRTIWICWNFFFFFLLNEIYILIYRTETSNISDFFQPTSAIKVHQPIFSYRVEMHLLIYWWQESQTETNWSYFFLNYWNMLLGRKWHLFYDFLSFGFSSCIRLNETILYHSAVVITPNFDVCLVFGSKCHCVTEFTLGSRLQCVCEHVCELVCNCIWMFVSW